MHPIFWAAGIDVAPNSYLRRYTMFFYNCFLRYMAICPKNNKPLICIHFFLDALFYDVFRESPAQAIQGICA